MKLQTKILQNQEIKRNRNILKKYIYQLIKPYTEKEIISETNRIYNKMKQFTKDNSAIIIGALEKNMLIGFIWGYIIQENTEIAHVNYFFIQDEYRNKGIGKLLLKELEEELFHINVKKIELLVDISNKRAIKFYSKNGFEIQEENNKKLKIVKQIINND